jgi:hypothetical protein
MDDDIPIGDGQIGEAEEAVAGQAVSHRRYLGAQIATFIAAGVFSSLVVYPLIHETGHLLPALWSGAEVNRFVWTPLMGRPHVSLNLVSGAAKPWVAAGGVLLPTLVGTLLFAAWLLLPPKRPIPLWRYWLLFPGITLLSGNLGLLIERFTPPEAYRHMTPLAGAVAGGSVLFELAPALWSGLLFGLVAVSAWRQRFVQDR